MKYRIFCNVQWDAELEATPEEIIKIASKRLTEILPQDVSYSLLKVKNIKSSQKKKILAIFEPEEVLSHISNTNQRKQYQVRDKTYNIRMNSHRYLVFRASRKCAACGLRGTKFLLEQQEDECPHFNLYAEDNGELVLMTVDHIKPKSRGGQDRYDNYGVLCAPCNNLKGSDPFDIKQVAELRKIFNENKRKVTRKELAHLLSDAKRNMLSTVPGSK